MRVIGGGKQRRQLRAPPTEATRPILDRVKQPLFDALACQFGVLPGALPPLCVLDLYCGGGTLGIEALSRGARHVVFVERGAAALATLRENLSLLQLTDRCEVRCGDVVDVVQSLAAQPPRCSLDNGAAMFDLVFLDPPFPDSAACAPGMPVYRTLELLRGPRMLATNGLVIWRYPSGPSLTQRIPTGWRVASTRRYGRNELAWLSPGSAHD